MKFGDFRGNFFFAVLTMFENQPPQPHLGEISQKNVLFLGGGAPLSISGDLRQFCHVIIYSGCVVSKNHDLLQNKSLRNRLSISASVNI